jgi:hypothetical protein
MAWQGSLQRGRDAGLQECGLFSLSLSSIKAPIPSM